MSFRKKLSKKKSARIFRKTANKTLKVNSAPPVTRGGIRL